MKCVDIKQNFISFPQLMIENLIQNYVTIQKRSYQLDDI